MGNAGRSIAVGVLLASGLAFAAQARINWCIPKGNTATNNIYECQVLFDGNGSASRLELVTFSVAQSSTKATRNAAAAAAIIAKGASLSPAFTLTGADIGPD